MSKLSDYKAVNLTPEQAERTVRESGITLYWNVFEDGWSTMDPAPLGEGHWVPDHIVARLLIALTSIAANTCCDSCREAALVARAALAATEKKEAQ